MCSTAVRNGFVPKLSDLVIVALDSDAAKGERSAEESSCWGCEADVKGWQEVSCDRM